jgi:hypothetical protein
MKQTLNALVTGLLLLLSAAHSANAADFSCYSDTNLTLQIYGLQANPGNVSSLSLMDPNQNRDILITKVVDSGDSVYVEFSEFTTSSAFSFEIGKESIEFGSVSLSVFELGGPGGIPQYHQFNCQKY